MTVEKRLERLEREAGFTPQLNRPEIGTQFWMRGASSVWAVWDATHEGIAAINDAAIMIRYSWLNFDSNTQNGNWQWKPLVYIE